MEHNKIFDGTMWNFCMDYHNVKTTNGGMWRVDYELDVWNDLISEEEQFRINGVAYLDTDGNAVMKDPPEIMFSSYSDWKKCYPVHSFPEHILSWIFEVIAIDPYEFFWKVDKTIDAT